MSANHYRFKCPVQRKAVPVEHCENIHARMMVHRRREELQDNPDHVRCGLAHLCYKCPFRHMISGKGAWHGPGGIPRIKELTDKVHTLPRETVEYALRHANPKPRDYGVFGLAPGALDAEFEAMTADARASGELSEIATGTTEPRDLDSFGYSLGHTEPQPKRQAKPAPRPEPELADDMLGAAIEKAARRENARQPQSAPESAKAVKPAPSTPAKKTPAQKRAQRPSGQQAKPKLTLAERAALMKKRSAP